jgi:hypothetical protein
MIYCFWVKCYQAVVKPKMFIYVPGLAGNRENMKIVKMRLKSCDIQPQTNHYLEYYLPVASLTAGSVEDFVIVPETLDEACWTKDRCEEMAIPSGSNAFEKKSIVLLPYTWLKSIADETFLDKARTQFIDQIFQQYNNREICACDSCIHTFIADEERWPLNNPRKLWEIVHGLSEIIFIMPSRSKSKIEQLSSEKIYLNRISIIYDEGLQRIINENSLI